MRMSYSFSDSEAEETNFFPIRPSHRQSHFPKESWVQLCSQKHVIYKAKISLGLLGLPPFFRGLSWLFRLGLGLPLFWGGFGTLSLSLGALQGLRRLLSISITLRWVFGCLFILFGFLLGCRLTRFDVPVGHVEKH